VATILANGVLSTGLGSVGLDAASGTGFMDATTTSYEAPPPDVMVWAVSEKGRGFWAGQSWVMSFRGPGGERKRVGIGVPKQGTALGTRSDGRSMHLVSACLRCHSYCWPEGYGSTRAQEVLRLFGARHESCVYGDQGDGVLVSAVVPLRFIPDDYVNFMTPTEQLAFVGRKA